MTITAADILARESIFEDLDDPLRVAALASLAAVTFAYLQVLGHAVDVAGGGWGLHLVSGIAFLGAVVMAGLLVPRAAAVVGGVGLILGLGVYLALIPQGWGAVLNVPEMVRNMLALLTGYTILSIMAVDLWAMAVAPAPIFLSWYLALRERYAGAAGIGLAMVVFFIATGDAGTSIALLGVLGAAGTVGFGELSRRGARAGEADLLALVLAIMLILSLTVSVIPGGGAQPISPEGAGGSGGTTESDLIGGGQMEISGEPTLDPELRFTISADEGENWRIDAYDRYTGDGWVQTGESEPFDGSPGLQDGVREELFVTPEVDRIAALPAHWLPVEVSGTESVRITPDDGLEVETGLEEGTTYRVISDRPAADLETLRGADGPVPASIHDRYTQLPDSTPDRVGEFTAELTNTDETAYQTAETIESYLTSEFDYSLDIDGFDGDVADEQLFEREAGYCATFATTMAAMLRTQDIPARVVTGYSSGERVDEDRWVVRGMNAHAWVEVYISGVGWVDFDPTPSAPYDDARQERLDQAREDGEENIDTDETGGDEWTPDGELDDENETDLPDIDNGIDEDRLPPGGLQELQQACDNPDAIEEGILTEAEAFTICTQEQLEELLPDERLDDPSVDTEDMPEPDIGTDEPSPEEFDENEGLPLPSMDQVAFVLALLIVGVAGARRRGLTGRMYQAVDVRWQGQTGDPAGAVERAWTRLEMHLESNYAARETGESVRAYVDRLDRRYDIPEEIRTVADRYEQARYAPTAITDEEASETVAFVDELIGTRVPRIRPPVR